MEQMRVKKRSKMFTIGASAILIIAAIVIGLCVSGSASEYESHLDMSEKYLEELNYGKAIVELRMAIEIEPNDSEAYFALAEVYVAMGDYESALAVLKEGYVATGDAALLAERERIAGEYGELQEQLAEQEERQQEQRVEEFYEKYAGLYALVTDEVLSGSRGYFDRYLTFAEREESYGGAAEQLEQYLTELDEIEGLPNELYSAEWSAHGVEGIYYLVKGGAYRDLAEIYLRMGKLEECLRVRTEWAAFSDRPDLVQDGNHGFDEPEDWEYDKYGRMITYYYEASDDYSTYIYDEFHDGATHWTKTKPGELWEDDYTYDNEGRIRHWHRVITYEGEGVTILDTEYTFTGNNSYVATETIVRPDGSTDVYQSEENYDKYGRAIY